MATAKKTETGNWAMTALGRERRALLKSRISHVSRARWGRDDDEEPRREPAAVVAARKVIAAHDKKIKAADRKRKNDIEAACEEAEKQVLFAASAHDALRAVEQLEARARKSGWVKG